MMYRQEAFWLNDCGAQYTFIVILQVFQLACAIVAAG